MSGPASLFDALAMDHPALADRIATAMHEQVDTYGGIPHATLAAGVLVELEIVLASARGGRDRVDADELAGLAAVGEARAAQGVPIEAMLRAWRVAISVTVAAARETAVDSGIDAADLLEFVETILAWADVAMVVTSRAHRDAEIALARRDAERRATFLRGLLLGSLDAAEIGVQAGWYGLDPTRDWVAVRARGDDPTALERALRLSGPGSVGAATAIDGDLAAVLPRPPAEVTVGVVGVGSALPLHRAAESFRLAGRALVTATSFGLTGCHDVASLGLRAAIVADGDVGESLRRRYLMPLQEADPRGDLVAGLRAWFECGMHVESAAARLFVHQNTLRARLARVEALLDVSLRDRMVTFELWWALERDLLSSNGTGSTGDPRTPEPAP